MGRRTTKARKPKERQGPSPFFIVALVVGAALVFWLFVTAVSKPVAPPQKPVHRTMLLVVPPSEPC